MVESGEEAPTGLPPPEPGSPLDEGLGYLLAFSEAVLDLIPDGVAILDDRLRVRNANGAFLEQFAPGRKGADPPWSLAGSPFLRAVVPDRGGRSLGDELGALFEEEGELELLRFEAPALAGEPPAAWEVRAEGWDTEDPRYRRVLLWVRSAEPYAGEPAVLREKRERVQALTELSDRLLALVPGGVCVLDPALRVRAASPRFERAFGRRVPPEDGPPVDRHVFALFPELRDEDFLALLGECRSGSGSVRGSLRTSPEVPGGPRTWELEIQPVGAADDEVRDLLIILHGAEGVGPMPEFESLVGQPVARTLEDILSPSHLERWPSAVHDRILVVEADAWTRMILSDALRLAGYADIVLVDSGHDALARHDPAGFGLVLVGFDGDPEDVREFCLRCAEAAPRVPILALTEREDAEAPLVDGLPLAGLLAGPPDGDRLRRVARAFLKGAGGESSVAHPPSSETVPAPESSAPESSATVERPSAPTPLSGEAGPVSVLVLGAAADNVADLRSLHEEESIRIRMVYDPDPSAPGLELARSFGVPCLSGELSLHLERPPDAVVLLRPELESRLADLGLAGAATVSVDELELFLGDPASYLDADRHERAMSGELAGTAPPAADSGPTSPEDATAGTSTAVEPPVAEIPIPEAPAPEPLSAHGAPPVLEVPPVADDTPVATEDEPARAPFEPPAAAGPAPFEPPAAEPAPEPAPEPEPTRTFTPPPRAVAPPRPERRTAPSQEPSSPHGAPLAGGASEDLGSLLGALDLLLDFDRFADRILRMAVDMTRGTSGSLMLMEESGEVLRIVASTGLSDMVIQNTRQRVGEGIAGRVAEDGEPLLLVGRVGDERFKTRGERPEIRSSVCVPLLSDGRVVGVLNVNSDPDLRPFDRDELRLVSRLGQQVGTALDRSRQLRRMRSRSFELSVRGEVESIAAAEIDLPARLSRIASRLVQMLNADTCSIWLREPEADQLALGAIAGLDVRGHAGMSVSFGTGLVGWVARNLRPLVLRSGPDRGLEAAFQLVSAAVPIRHHTDLLGVLALETSAQGGFDEERLRLLSTVASVIGQHVGESRMHQASERKVTMLSALSELGVAFSAARERVGLARLVSFTAATVMESDVAAVRLLKKGAPPSASEPDWYERLAVHGATVSGSSDPLAEIEERISREVVATHRRCRDTELPLAEVEPLLERSNVEAALGVPMLSGDELLGVITVYRVVDPGGRNFPYQDSDLEIGERLGDYAGAAASRFLGEGSGPEGPA